MTQTTDAPGGRRVTIRKTDRTVRWSSWVALGLVLLFTFYFTWMAVQRHLSFDSGGFDLGVYDQVVWNTSQGRLFFYTTTGMPLLHLSNHADPILLLVAPLYWLHAGPETLILLQALVIALGGLPLLWVARKKTGSDLAGLCLLAAYLLFPALQVVTLSDFHPPALAVGFLMFAFYFLERRTPLGVLIFCVLAMACKEEMPLVVMMMGLFAILYYRRRRLGLTVLGLGLAWFLVVMYWVIPAFSVTGGHIFLDYYADLGSTPFEIVITAVSRPDLVLRNLWQADKLTYLRDILAPFAGLPILGLPVTAIGAPALAINLLSSKAAMHDATQGHYSADVAPWLAWGALFGISYVQSLIARWRPGSRRLTAGAAGLILLCISLAWQVFHGFSPLSLNAPHWSASDHDQLAARFLDQIPPDAGVAAQGELYPHLSDRQYAYHLPAIGDAQYVIVDVASTTRSIHPQDLKRLLRGLLEGGEFGVLDAADGYLLLKRGQSGTELPDAFYDFARVPAGDAQPQHPLQIDFGDQLRLLGFDVLDDPGRQETSVKLYWQALKAPAEKVSIRPFFLDPAGNVVEDTSQRPLVTQLWYPPRLWQPGEVIVTQTLPWTLGDRWSLALGVQNGSQWSDWSQRLPITAMAPGGELSPRRFEANTWVRLATFANRWGRSRLITTQDEDLSPAFPLQADLGAVMGLTGYSLEPEVVKAGQSLQVSLFWRALAPMAVDYTVFVHMLGPDGAMVAQHDGQPQDQGPAPTSSWQPGETLRDTHILALPPDLPAGAYQLEVGVYFWETQERLPVMEAGVVAGDMVRLGQVEVR